MGADYIQSELKLEAANAVHKGEKLAEIVLENIKNWQSEKGRPAYAS